MNFKVEPATRDDFSAILALHAANHISNMSESEKKDGFLTLPIEISHLEQLQSEGSLFVARGENGDLAGYVLSGTWDFYRQWPMFSIQTQRFPVRFESGELNLENSFQYGPVCVSPNYRGMGVLNALFEAVRTHFSLRYKFGGTFISRLNHRSLEAHTRKLRFKIVDEWSVNNNNYVTLAFSTLSK
jgi:ribosomal protein S18 acetylase RimI-like enzyme